MGFNHILQKQKSFFKTHETKDIQFRISQLSKLKTLIIENESILYDAVYKDFGKSKFDTYTTEISLILKDIDFFISNCKKLSKPSLVKTNLSNQLGKSKIYYEPLGNILIIGAWNYPLQLTLCPMIAAVAAGNTCIVKPSELAFNTMKAIASLMNTNFTEDFIYFAEGGIEETKQILELKFDKIFFTGSPKVGKIVYMAAAKHLTPVTLELGGKSPAIVSAKSNIDVAAKRIVWGKFLNGGQTCVAPDYVYVESSIKNDFLQLLKKYIRKFNYNETSTNYTRIINQRNFERLIQLISEDKTFEGGNYNEEKLWIEPTVLTDITWEDNVMNEEIFGPILPVLEYENFDDVLYTIQEYEKPLAAYLFSNNIKEKEMFINTISFGGGCINDVVMHFTNTNLPFGGVGQSGMGNYHGKYSFYTFSHAKSILDRATWGEPNLKYPPYSEEKSYWIKKLI